MVTSPYPFATTWTGAGDGTTWSDPANWSNGVPLPAAQASQANQDIATINNSVDTAPFGLVIDGSESAGEIDIDLANPAGGGPAVLLTGTLAMSTNVNDSGSGFGLINLDAGTFEIDGTLTGAEVALQGGTLTFGSDAAVGPITLGGDIIDGDLPIDNGATIIMAPSNGTVFDGLNGGVADVTISNGSTLSVLGSIYVSGLIDVQAGGTLSLDGGALNGWGSGGTFYADGGAVNVTQGFSVDGKYTFEGGLNFAGAETVTVAAGADLIFGVAPGASTAPTVINLNGSTIDVTGGLNLINTVLENGTVILESGSTYTADATSSISGVTLTDNRPAEQTNWTGAAGDGNWSNALNWTNGVPQSGVGFTTDGQSVAVINNIIDQTPSTITIANDVKAQDIYLATSDPSNGPSVLLTGDLDTSYGTTDGAAYGYLDLVSGTFQLGGYSELSYTGIGLNGGTLAFDNISNGAEFLNTDIVNGDFTIYDSQVLTEGYNVFHGQGGGGPGTVTLNGGGILEVASGTLALDGEIDIQDGSDNTEFVLDGGNLSGYGGDAANIFIDGGEFAVGASTTFSNTVNIYGGVMVIGDSDAVITITIDSSSVTSIGQAGGAQTVVNLNGGTLDVYGTLNLTNTYIYGGTITIEAGATFNQDATDSFSNVTITGGLQTATSWTGEGDGTSWSDPANWSNGVPLAGGPYATLGQNVTTIDNSVDTSPFTVVITGDQAGALVLLNATDPAGGVAARLEGTLDLDLDDTGAGGTLGVLDVNGGTFEVDGGTLQVLNVNQLGGTLTFGSFAQWGAATLNAAGIAGNLTIGNASELIIAQNSFGAFNNAAQGSANTVTITDNSTLDIKGSLYSSNDIDIVSGSVILDGGSLGMASGNKLVSEGGVLSVLGNGTLNSIEYDGAVSVGSNNTLTISSGNTALISNAAGPWAIDIASGDVEVSGTLDVDGIITGAGDLSLDAGGTLSGATVNGTSPSTTPTVYVNGNATLDNVAIDAPIYLQPGVTLTTAGTETFGNAADTVPMTVNLGGGVLDVTGTLNLADTAISDGTIIVESGATLTIDAASSLTGVTVEKTLANGDLEITGENDAITTLETLTTANGVILLTGVDGNGAATGTPGEVTFYDPTDDNNPVGFTGAGTVTVTDGNGVSKTDFNGATLDADVSGQTLDFATDTYLANYGSFTATNGGSLVIGDAANASANLVGGVVNAGISATGGSSVLFYGANGISVVNGSITIDPTSSIGVATAAGTVALAQSLTSIGSQNPTTDLDQLGVLNLNNGASFIDPNAVTLYGTVNLTGGTFSTAGLSGNTAVLNSGFGYDYASGVLGYGTLSGPFGSQSGDIYMEASGGTLAYTGTITGYDSLIADTGSELIVNANLDTDGGANGYYLSMKAGATIDLTGTIGDASGFYTTFAGSNATLELADPTGLIMSNIQAGGGAYTNDVIDLAGLVAATGTGGTPDVTITRTSGGNVIVTIVPAGDTAAPDTFTITGAGNTKVTFNPSDGNGGSQIVLTADPVITTTGAASLVQGYTGAVGGISLADIGLPADQSITATLTDTYGLLSATGTGITGEGTTALTITGTVTQVNAALATLTDTDSSLANDIITVSATDSAGNSAASATDYVYVTPPITIYAVTQQTASQTVATPLLYTSVYEQSLLNDANLTVTIAAGTGILTDTASGATGSGTSTLTLTGNQEAINSELSALTITEGTPGTDTVSINAQDAAGDKAPTVDITVTTVSTPTINAPFSEAVTQNAITPLSGLSIGEVGATAGESFHVTLTDTGGLLSATGDSVTGAGTNILVLNGSMADINSELATLTIDEPNSGGDTLTMAVTDQYGGTASQNVAITSTHVDAPDLTVSAITAPSSGLEGQSVQLSWTVTNNGDATATGPWTDNVYVATDASGDNKVLVGSFTYTGTLAVGQSETQTQSITLPTSLAINTQTGTAAGYFVVQADAGNQTGALSGIQNHLSVATTSTPVTAPVNWSTVFAEIMPSGIDATDYALIEQRWVAEVGTTDASFATAINQAIAALDKTSATPATSADALQLLARQAVGGLVDQTLAQVTDPSGTATGLDTLLTPSYSSTLTARNSGGAFGDGWASEFNDVGALGPMNGLNGERGVQGGYVVTYVTTYVDQYGDYLGQTTTYHVVAPAAYGVSLLDPTNPYSNYTQTNANGTIETFSGTTGLLIGIADSSGNAITITRNNGGVITGITTASGHPPVFTVNAEGNITSATDSAGNTITYTYDATGTHLLSTTTSAGTTSYQYATSTNAFIQNALTQVTAPDGSTQTYTYNAQGDIASQSANGAAATTYTYSSPNTIVQTNGDGQATTYTYDQNGQTTSTTDAAGNTSTIQRDSSGNVTAVTLASGGTYHYTYNASEQLTSSTDPLGNTYQYGYVPGTSKIASITDQNGNVTQYTYNAAGQSTGYTEANGTGSQYTYNPAGELSQLTEATGATTQYSYNALGEITNEAFSDGTSQSYTYDASGNMTSSTAVDGSVTKYTYNPQNLLTSVTNAAGQVETYSYNAAGQETQRVEPDGTITNYTYTPTGQLAGLTDGSGNVLATYTYDAAGHLTEKATGNGASTQYTYDASGNVTDIRTLASDGTTTSNIAYTYDADSRIATATSGDGTWTYTYDAANQLTHAVFASTNASIASQDLTYAYDAAGNRTQTIFNGATTNYTTNNLNQYTSADGTTYAYDANGNLITKVGGGVTTTYTYNVQNELTSSSDGTTTTTYTYDALGNIASQTVNGVRTTYVTDPLAIDSSSTGPLSAVAQAYNASGQTTATYTYGDGLTAVTSSGTTSYYNADASGNITSLSGANGALTQTYAYTPTGTLLTSNGSVVNPFQFNGLVGAMTQTDGLVNTRARYYDPTTGRFISEDPTGQIGGVNLYTYAGNNPVNYNDASGDDFSFAGFVGGVISIGGGIVAIAGATTLAAPALILLTTAGGFVAFGTGIVGLADSFNKPAGYHDTAADWGNTTLNAGLTFLGGGATSGATNAFVNTVGTINSGLGVTDGYGSVFTYWGDLYASYNQTVDDTVTVHVPKGGGHGDVHLTTFDGVNFDFQAVGEFVLAKSTVAGDNFQVQVRLSALGGSESSPTFTTEIGVQVGSDTVTFGASRDAVVWVDGVATNLSTTANTLTLAGGTISQLSQNTYQLTEKTGEVVNITDDGSYFDYTVALAPSATAGSVEGLLGTFSGTANSFTLPDGTVLGSSLTSTQLYQTFGNAWRITDATSLLNYGAGEDTATYTDLDHPDYSLPVASLPTAVVQAANDAAAAAGLTGTAATDAVYDYLATGDPSFITNAASSGSTAPVTSVATITQSAPPPPSIGISPVQPQVTEISGQTAVTFTVSLTGATTTNTVVNYAVSSTAIDPGKTYFDAADFGGTLPSGSVTILAGQTSATVTVDVPDSALGAVPDKWLAVGISTTGSDPIYATSAQVDVLNNSPVAGAAAQPLLEYVAGNQVGVSEFTPTLTQSGNSYTLNLGNVVQGTSLAALQFALANLAAAPADGLSAAIVGTSGAGFSVTGPQSPTLINAGNAYSGINIQALTTSLGAQSEAVTFGATDVNATGYAGALPNITLTVTDNVITAAQAKLGTTAIALPDVRVGSTDTQTITVTNTAATGAAPLDVTLGAAAGTVATGSISQLAAGASDSTSLSLGLSTAAAGAQSSFVTLNLASDLGNGVASPLPLNQSVAVTGSVYRAAAASTAQAATIVHVGDVGSQDLAITNSDPADGYSEGLRATVTGATGVSASGTTGLIAAGATDSSSIAVTYSTATSGLVFGQVNLGLTSDGTGVDTIAPLALGTDTVSFGVQVDNYATADIHETAGGGTLTGSAASGYDLDLGTLAQGSGPATIDLAAFNSANGLADLLAGTFGITANTASTAAFANSGFGAFSGLGAGQSDGALAVSLSTASDGTFSETITLTGTGSNASGYSGAVAPVTLTIHGVVSAETPVLVPGTVVTGAITEQPATTGSSAIDTAQGTIAFTDTNLASTHAASVTSVSASGVTTGLPGNGALLALLSLGTLAEDTSSTPGSVAWDFAAPDSTFDYLSAGETLTLTYAVQIAEVGGKSVTQNVAVTVTGTNDLPVIASGTTAAATIAAFVPGTSSPANDTASGTIDFTDPDLDDTHTATIASVSATGTVAGLPSNATLLTLLSTTALTEEAGAAPGSVGWNFSAPDATFAYLMPGQSVTLVYAVDISDNHGGTAVQDVTVTVDGASGTTVTSSTPGTFLGVSYASKVAEYTAAGFLYYETFYNASGTSVATASFQPNGDYTCTIGGVIAQTKTVNADGTYTTFYNSAGTGQGFAWATYTVLYSATGVREVQTWDDASGNAVAVTTYTANGGYTSSVGGVVVQVKTVNADGSNDTHYYSSTTFLGTAYASFDYAYTASGFRDAITYYDASGNLAATLAYQANGGYTCTIGGVVTQVKTVNSDGTYTTFYDSAGTGQGFAWASYTVLYSATGVREKQTYSDASGNVVAVTTYTANGGYTASVGGVVVQVKTVNSDGSNDTHYYSSATLLGTTYASFDYAYTASGFKDAITYYDASGKVAATLAYQPNGGYTCTIGGVVTQVKTVNADGTYTTFYNSGGTGSGFTWATYTMLYSATGVREKQTYSDASGNVVATTVFTPNGGYTLTVGGVVAQIKTVNADGSNDTHYYSGITFLGTSYASFDYAYTASGFRDAITYYDASGNLAATLAYQANGGYTCTIGGVVTQVKTVNSDGTYTTFYNSPGTQSTFAWATYTVLYSATGVREKQTYSDASGNVVAVTTFTANDGFTLTVGGVIKEVKTVNADGSYLIQADNVTGQSYTEESYAYTAGGSELAVSAIRTDGSNATILKAAGLTLTTTGGVETLGNGAETFQFGANTHGAINIAGVANTTLAFGTGDGAQTITGFATSGPGADVLSFSSSIFANYSYLMGATTTQGSDLLITLDPNDTILLKNVTKSSFTSANVHFT